LVGLLLLLVGLRLVLVGLLLLLVGLVLVGGRALLVLVGELLRAVGVLLRLLRGLLRGLGVGVRLARGVGVGLGDRRVAVRVRPRLLGDGGGVVLLRVQLGALRGVALDARREPEAVEATPRDPVDRREVVRPVLVDERFVVLALRARLVDAGEELLDVRV